MSLRNLVEYLPGMCGVISKREFLFSGTSVRSSVVYIRTLATEGGLGGTVNRGVGRTKTGDILRCEGIQIGMEEISGKEIRI
jgi:hypothetical protein